MRFVSINGNKYCCQSDVSDTLLLQCLEEHGNLINCDKKQELAGSFGRAQISKFMLGDIPCVIRSYNRGGYFAKINQRNFFTFNSKYRPFFEFLVLDKLLGEGIRVPTPLVSLVKPRLPFIYQGGIVLKELVESQNLLNMIIQAEREPDLRNDIIEFCFLTGREARKCLEFGVKHIDLHPGNVLIRGRLPYLIDFDKSVNFIVNDTLMEQGVLYLSQRWTRSVQKRLNDKNFASQIIGSFEKGLRFI